MTIAQRREVQASLRALAFAGKRFVDVWWTGLLMILFWGFAITVGPVIESKAFPVISHFRIAEIRALPDPNTLSFRPAFRKTRECRYLGMTWFVKDDKGQIARHQVQLSKDTYEPTTSPPGEILGSWWDVGVSDGDREMFGVLHHSCGLPWESRSVVGPFRLSQGADKISYEAPLR